MIRVTTIANAQAAKNYFSAPDYFLAGQEEPAHWHGKGADLLGLSGPVNYRDFESLCDNLHPKTGEQLTAKHISNRRVGYDWTFSPSKSVSLAYIAGDTRIADAFREAVNDTMSEIEREMQTRVRKHGAFENRTTGNLIYVDFVHKTSRPIKGVPDPQLHVHAVVLNATYDSVEGQWKAGEFGALKANAPYYQAVFRAHLANKMQDLGYELTRTKDDFEISGISKDTIKKFSRRTNLIEKIAGKLQANLDQRAELGEIPAGSKLSEEAKSKIGAGSREAKSDAFTWEQLVKVWTSQLTLAEQEALLPGAEPVIPEDHSKEAVSWALSHLLERNSVIPQRDVIREALKHGIGNVTVENVVKELGRPGLIRRDIEGTPMVTTWGVLNEERAVLGYAQKGRGRFRPLASPSQVPTDLNLATTPAFRQPGSELRAGAPAYYDALALNPLGHGQGGPIERPVTIAAAALPETAITLPSRQPELSPTQAAAVRHALSSRDPLILIRGAAGTGKTHMTRALLEQVNVPWVILAPSAEASRGVLRREGFQDADTLAHFLLDEDTREKARNGLIVLDEASLVGSHDMYRLTQSAKELNARILLLGDRRQHKSVARGDILALLEDRAGLPVAEVSEIRRQSGEYKTAVSLASKGNVAAAVKKLDDLGWVKETDRFADAGKVIADEYVTALEEGKSVLVVSPTHAEGDKATAAIREKLKQKGTLHGQETRVETLTSASLTDAEKTDPETLKAYAGSQAQYVRHGTHRAGQRVTITEENVTDLAKEGSRFAVYKPKNLDLAPGDLLRVTAGIKDTDGKRIDNGTMLTYLGSENGKFLVETASGTKRFLPQNVGHLSYGYVSTSHSAQGKTVDRVLIHAPTASFGAVDKSTGYVAISRGRQKATIFTDSRESLLEAVERERPRMLASELVRRPRHKVRERLKRHVAFLRDLGNEITRRAREVVRPREREMAIER